MESAGTRTLNRPDEVYTPSPRLYRGLGEVDYPLHNWTATVTRCGRMCWKRRKINLSAVFAGQNVGVRQVSMCHPPTR